MTIAHLTKKAKEMPNYKTETVDQLFIGGILFKTQSTFQRDSLAHAKASEVFRSANYVGVSLSVKDILTQEKWERILLALDAFDLYPCED